jgi:lantibiotic modifying enzyme
LSHGAGGIAFALLALFEATGYVRFRHGAEMGMQYERGWFDPQHGNWADLRENPHRRGSPRRRSYTCYWCHGAAGIALSRLRAFQIFGDERCKQEAAIGLETTCAEVESSLRADSSDFSLCHGLGGNGDILAEGERVLGTDGARFSELAERVGRFGIDRYLGGVWPCGTHNQGDTPSLMIGSAGIGYFFLRLHDRRVPSLLALRREDWVGYWPR